MSRNALLFLVLSFAFFGCQSNPLREFSDLRQGMYKDEVLDIAGSPSRTQRWHGMDRWTYIYFLESNQMGWKGTDRAEKEVHFASGRAVYVGDKPKPDISAEEQDRINEESNIALEREAAERRAANTSAVRQFNRPPDDDEDSAVRYVPSYEPID